MYRAYNIEGHPWKEWGMYTYVVSLLEKNGKTIKSTLEGFVTKGVVNGTKLSEHWFPTVKADIFISHSHTDEDEALRCASWLKDTFELDAFIDSSVWGYADDLLKQIDNDYCLNQGGETYSYEKRNGSTSHVHMMLATALSEMIDRTECVFF
jgi:hypothetical protein